MFSLSVALQAFLSVTGNISLGSDSTLDCTISSPIQNLNSDMQWIGPDGTVLQDVDSVTSLRQSFTPFQTSDLGDYTCISTISSPDFPGVTSTVSSTVTINRKWTFDKFECPSNILHTIILKFLSFVNSELTQIVQINSSSYKWNGLLYNIQLSCSYQWNGLL